MFAHKASQQVIDAIIDLAEQAAKEPWELKVQADSAGVKAKLKKLIGKDLEAAYKLTDKQPARPRSTTRAPRPATAWPT